MEEATCKFVSNNNVGINIYVLTSRKVSPQNFERLEQDWVFIPLCRDENAD